MKRIIILILIMLLSPAYGESKYPDYNREYTNDRFEGFNRKVFTFNNKINKYAIRPITVLWSCIMPKYGMERIKGVYSNILYPRYLVSSLAQGNIKKAGYTTARFIVNSTIGLGGMFDPAKKILNLKPTNEDMEQVLAKWKIKAGPYLVLPLLYSSTPRALLGKALDTALDPSCYMGSSVIAAIKAGFTVNNATMTEPLAIVLEKNYIDPYDILKKLYSIQREILNKNLDEKNILEIEDMKIQEEEIIEEIAKENMMYNVSEIIKGSAATEEIILDDLIPDIILKNFNPQHPVIDSMRTALFEIKGTDDSIWGELSLWNRSFSHKIKTGYLNIIEGRKNYNFRYIMQKNKNSPLAIIYPSVGESADTHHSVMFAKIFYDEGYSVLILSSAFHYSFLQSMEKGYAPGIPENDAEHLKIASKKIINKFEQEGYTFKNRTLLGTSYGGITALFLADKENKNNELKISKFISVNPPFNLVEAISIIDENSENWNDNADNLKERTTVSAAKILALAEDKKEGIKIETLPFSLKEAKMITGFILHQKLSDLIFAMEEINPNKKTDFYEKMNNFNYKDYAEKYLLSKKYENLSDFSEETSLNKIKDYLIKSNNYRIYHSMDDYLTNREELKILRKYAGEKMKLISAGGHLGFLYRDEFINDLRKEISFKENSGL